MRTGTRRSTRLLAGLALVAGIGVVVALVTSSGSPSKPTGQGGKTGPGTGVATVSRRNLKLDDTQAGTVSYSDPQTVYNRLNGTITWLPSVGQEIKPGGTLFKVDGKPVILMDGSTPAYRNLTPADGAGADILELNRNLVALGFEPGAITVDDTWQAATTDGVDLLQESLGETPTGSLSLGQVVFLPGDRLISTVEGTLGSGNGSPSSTASTPVEPSAPEFVSLTVSPGAKAKRRKQRQPSHKSKPPHHPRTLAALVALLRAEVQELRSQQSPNASNPGTDAPDGGSPSGGTNPNSSPAGSGKPNGNGNTKGNGGGGGASPQAVLETTSTHLVVTVDLSATSQSEARVGEHVGVEMPAGNTVGGKITAVSPVAQNSSNSNDNGSSDGGGGGNGSGNGTGNGTGSGSSSTIPVTIALSGRGSGAGLDQAAVSVNFVQQRANHVLSVPVTALLATSGTSYAVQEAAAPHQLIPVTTGLFAAGYVQISGPGVFPGLKVTDSQG